MKLDCYMVDVVLVFRRTLQWLRTMLLPSDYRPKRLCGVIVIQNIIYIEA